MKALIVGQAPSCSSGHERAFDGASGKRLAACLGMTLLEFLSEFDTANMLRKWPGKHGGKYAYREKGDRFPVAKARRRVWALTQRAEVIVLCGSNVAEAWDIPDWLPVFTWAHYSPAVAWHRYVLIAKIPHPSGCNLLWNDPGVREKSAAILSQARAVASR
jgi:uracil-DNA glycosylase